MLYLINNALAGGGVVLSSTSENADYPRENLHAGDPAVPFRFGAAAADDWVACDLGVARDVDFVSLHGHNLAAGVAPKLYSKAAAFGAALDDGDLEATLVPRDPAFFARFTATSRRYWRLVLAGAAGAEAVELGELVLGLGVELEQPPFTVDWAEGRGGQQIRHKTPVGSSFVYNLSRHPSRRLVCTFEGHREVLDEIRAAVYVATKHGALPVVLVPWEGQTDVVLARVGGDIPFAVEPPEYYSYRLEAEELGFGAVARP